MMQNNIDIVCDSEFNHSNEILFGKCKQLKSLGLGSVIHKNELEPEDLKLLYQSFDISDPVGLQRKVWTDIMLYMIRRGRENVWEMEKNTFSEYTDGTGQAFIAQIKDELDKNHKGISPLS